MVLCPQFPAASCILTGSEHRQSFSCQRANRSKIKANGRQIQRRPQVALAKKNAYYLRIAIFRWHIMICDRVRPFWTRQQNIDLHLALSLGKKIQNIFQRMLIVSLSWRGRENLNEHCTCSPKINLIDVMRNSSLQKRAYYVFCPAFEVTYKTDLNKTLTL